MESGEHRGLLGNAQGIANLVGGDAQLTEDLRIEKIRLTDIGDANARLKRNLLAEVVADAPREGGRELDGVIGIVLKRGEERHPVQVDE